MHLLIISHTSHYKDSTGIIKGWGPTVREINFLASRFEKITHLAYLHDGEAPESCIEYDSSNIIFSPLPPSGGKSIWSKIKSLATIPSVISKVNSAMLNADAIQLRVPTGLANYLLPFFTLKKEKPLLWVKYAGNWKQENAPPGYKFQRYWLKNNFLKCKVTINGSWADQESHCFTFENPCLDSSERHSGKKIIEVKNYVPPYTATFIGRIEAEKGVQRIIDALAIFQRKQITTIHFIGEGKDREKFEKKAKLFDGVKCIFHGSVNRAQIPGILEQSHFLLLPSTASEGFPKAIAEGANYGAIPIVSNISSIGQYINEQNGFVWNRNEDFNNWLENLIVDPSQLAVKSKACFEISELFTFESYFHKLQTLVLNDH